MTPSKSKMMAENFSDGLRTAPFRPGHGWRRSRPPSRNRPTCPWRGWAGHGDGRAWREGRNRAPARHRRAGCPSARRSAGRPRGCSPAGPAAGDRAAAFLRLVADIDLEEAVGPPARLGHRLGERRHQRRAVDRMDRVEQCDGIAGLVGLQAADQVEPQVRRLGLERAATSPAPPERDSRRTRAVPPRSAAGSHRRRGFSRRRSGSPLPATGRRGAAARAIAPPTSSSRCADDAPVMAPAIGSAMPRRQPLPRLWLMTDERQGEGLWAALERLPKGAGVVFRHYGLRPSERRKLFERIRRGSQTPPPAPSRGCQASGRRSSWRPRPGPQERLRARSERGEDGRAVGRGAALPLARLPDPLPPRCPRARAGAIRPDRRAGASAGDRRSGEGKATPRTRLPDAYVCRAWEGI